MEIVGNGALTGNLIMGFYQSLLVVEIKVSAVGKAPLESNNWITVSIDFSMHLRCKRLYRIWQ